MVSQLMIRDLALVDSHRVVVVSDAFEFDVIFCPCGFRKTIDGGIVALLANPCPAFNIRVGLSTPRREGSAKLQAVEINDVFPVPKLKDAIVSQGVLDFSAVSVAK